MARPKSQQQPPKDPNGTDEKRGGYSGAADAASVPPPTRLPSAYLPAPKTR